MKETDHKRRERKKWRSGGIRSVLHACLMAFGVAAFAGTAFAACLNPGGAAGQVIYNSDYNLMQYCNNTNWIAMSNTPTGPTKNLLAWWKLDESAGTSAADNTGHGYTGTLVNAPAWSSTGGAFGGALQFSSGSDQKVDHALALPTPAGTVSLWIKSTNLTGNRVAYYQSDGSGSGTYDGFGDGTNILEFTLGQINGDGTIQVTYQDGTGAAGAATVTSTRKIIASQWRHIVATWNTAGFLKLYIDGILDSSTDMSSLTFAGKVPVVMRLGNTGWTDGTRRWDGFLDDVRVYNRELSVSEIGQLYNLGDHSGHALFQTAIGGSYACGIDISGAGKCWGTNSASGFLGNNSTSQSNSPVTVSGGHVFRTITATESATCALDTANKAWCWGSNASGAFGNGTQTDSLIPVAAGNGMTFTVLSGGSDHSCGITPAGKAYCWGANGTGQTGNGTTTTPQLYPSLVKGGYLWKSIAVGSNHSCGITTGGDAYCWGTGSGGRLGDGLSADSAVPSPVSGGYKWAYISARASRTCGVTTSGDGYCWGSGAGGALGHGGTADKTAPFSVAGSYKWLTINAGYYTSCGVTTDNTGYCWGANANGEVGDGTTVEKDSPTAVGGSRKWLFIGSGGNGTGTYGMSCGITTAGDAWCWGEGSNGQLGDNTATDSPSPVLVYGGSLYGTVGCSSPTGAEGTIVYDETYKIMQYCDGKGWRAMAEATFSNAGKRQPVPAPDVAHWRLDTGSGTTAYDSVGANNGTLTNGPAWVAAGRLGRALDFDGTNDYVDIPMVSALNLTGSTVTLSAWIKADVTTGIRRIVSAPTNEGAGTEKYALILNANTVQFFIRTGTTDTSVSTAFTSTTAWNHIAGVYDGTNMYIYVNGAQANSAAKTGSIASSTSGNVQIGRFGPTFGQYFDGMIDDVRIYSAALSAAEVNAVYQQGLKTVVRPDVAWWTLDESAGPVFKDRVGGHDAMLYNANMTTVHAAGKIGNGAVLDGVDDYIRAGDPRSGALDFDATTSFSYGLWVNATANVGTGDMPLFKGGSAAGQAGYDMELGSGAWTANISDGTTQKSVTIAGAGSTAAWKHVFVVVDRTANTVSSYLDGAFQNSTSITGLGSLANSLYLTLGADNTPASYFQGKIDDVRIYGRALTANEIQAIYNATGGTYQCTGPNGMEGEMIYNTDNTKMQYCNNAEWVGIP